MERDFKHSLAIATVFVSFEFLLKFPRNFPNLNSMASVADPAIFIWDAKIGGNTIHKVTRSIKIWENISFKLTIIIA